MIIKRVTLYNYGPYHGTHTIHFPWDNQEKHVTLIGGLNGRGKTTLLDAITLCLYGRRALHYLHDGRIKYSQYLRNQINKSASREETSIALTISHIHQFPGDLTIRRTWSVNERSEVIDFFSATKDGQADAYLTDNWDYCVEEILPLNISRFFFFDNEKISQLADEETFDDVKDSIRSLLGLTTIDQLITDMRKISKSIQAEKKIILEDETNEKLADIDAQYKAHDIEMAQSIQERARLQTALGISQKDYAKCEKAFWLKGGTLGLKKDDIKEKKHVLEQELAVKIERVISLVSSSATPLLVCRKLIFTAYNHISDLEQQKAVRYSEHIIDMLSSYLNREEYPSDFILQAEHFLKNARQKIEESSKASEENFSLSSSAYLLMSSLISEGGSWIRDISSMLKEICDINNSIYNSDIFLNFEGIDDDVKDLWDEMQRLTSGIMTFEAQIKTYFEREKKLISQMETLKRRRESLLLETLARGQDQALSTRAICYAAYTENIMEIFKKKIQAKRTFELQHKVFDCFRFMLQKDSLIQSIEIHPDTLETRIVDYKGNELLKSQLSAGEKQLFAVSILWGLAQCSGYEMPVIIDTPLGRLDSQHRINFVERYLPYASRQVIVLSTDEEINGPYWELIKPNLNAVYTLEYDEKSRSTTIQPGYFGGKAV